MNNPNRIILRIDLEDAENPEVYYVPKDEDPDDFINRLRDTNGNDEFIIYKLSTINNLEDSPEITVISEGQAQIEYEEFLNTIDPLNNFTRGDDADLNLQGESPLLNNSNDQLLHNDPSLDALIDVVSAIGKMDQSNEDFDQDKLIQMLMGESEDGTGEEKDKGSSSD